jgi:hypothetical protein
MDDGIAHSATAVAGAVTPSSGSSQPFTRRQVMILRVMLAVMVLTLLGGGATVVAALVWKMGQTPAGPNASSAAAIKSLAAAQPGLMYSDASIPAGAKLIGTHLAGDDIVLIYDDSGGTTLARFDIKSWKLTGLARLSAGQAP